MALNPIGAGSAGSVQPGVHPVGKPTSSKPGFSKALSDLLSDVNGLQQEADQSVKELMAGNVENLHEVMISLGKAQVSFQFMAQVRNKLLDAYREVMRMQV